MDVAKIDIKIFNEKDVRAFFKIVSRMTEEKAYNEIEGTFPTSNVFHVFQGHKEGEIFFSVALLMTTDKDVLNRLENMIRMFVFNNREKFNHVNVRKNESG